MKAVIVIFLLVLCNGVRAQSNSSVDSSLSAHAIGVSVSMLSSSGVCYEYILDAINRGKITFLAFTENPKPNQSIFFYNVGAEYQYSFAKKNNTRLYLEFGGYYRKQNTSYEDKYYPREDDIEVTYAGGFGVGLELTYFKHLSISVDGSVRLGAEETTVTVTQDSYPYPYPYRTYQKDVVATVFRFGAGAALIYRF